LLFVAVPLSGAILLIGAYALLLPSFLGSLIAQELQGQLRLTEKPRVNLEGRLPGVLTGRFEGGRIALADPELGGVARCDELTVDLEPFDLDVLGGLQVGGSKVRSRSPATSGRPYPRRRLPGSPPPPVAGCL
jgi:hypothetical protein